MELNKRSPFIYQSTHRLLLLVNVRTLLFNAKTGVSGNGRTSRKMDDAVKQPLLSMAEMLKSVSSVGNAIKAVLSIVTILGLDSHAN